MSHFPKFSTVRKFKLVPYFVNKFMNYLIRKEERSTSLKRKIFMVSCYLLYTQMIDSLIRTGTLCTLSTVSPLVSLQYPELCPEQKWYSVNMFD